MVYVYLISSGHYARPRGFHDIFLFEEDIYSRFSLDANFRFSAVFLICAADQEIEKIGTLCEK